MSPILRKLTKFDAPRSVRSKSSIFSYGSFASVWRTADFLSGTWCWDHTPFSCYGLGQGFSNLHIWGQIILCYGGAVVLILCSRMLSSNPGFYDLNSSCKFPFHSQLWQPKVSADIAKCPLGGEIVLTECNWCRYSGITQYTWKTRVNLVFSGKKIFEYSRGLLLFTSQYVAVDSKILMSQVSSLFIQFLFQDCILGHHLCLLAACFLTSLDFPFFSNKNTINVFWSWIIANKHFLWDWNFSSRPCRNERVRNTEKLKGSEPIAQHTALSWWWWN